MDEDGWIRLESERRWTRWLGRVSPFDWGATDWWDFILVIVLGIVWVIGIAVLAATIRRPRVNLALRQLRIGRRVFDFSQITRVGLSVFGSNATRNFELWFGIAHGPTLYVRLAARGVAVMDARTRSLMASLLEGSSIETTAERRKRVNEEQGVAHGLFREEAIALVRTPPTTDRDLPLAY